ncbi:MAG TPA: MFS transporter [Gammaproteobacteria bacterium]|nr:MFS transporter [Gammaproteobacteria bacterium]
MPRKNSFKRNIPILALCQALFMSGTSLMVATTALVGFSLADNKIFASLPFTLQLVATMLTSIPAAILMAKIGRKASFLIGTLIAMLGAALCAYAVIQGDFLYFILGSILIGVFSGFANFYRFTAADDVDKQHKSRAISYVLAGGVLAAVIGPNLANLTRDSISGAVFAGSYASIIILYLLSFILLSFLDLPHDKKSFNGQIKTNTGRSLFTIAQQPRFIIAVICGMFGYATMTLVMTATPLAMHHHQHIYSDTAFVIQWHVLGMFAPSFITGNLIKRIGLLSVMFIGAIFGLASIFINLSGVSVNHFWLALLSLGISWNFLFIGATTLLTETYSEKEKFKTQALNDFLVFSVVAAASLSAGILHHEFGWKIVNYMALPAILIIFISLIWLYKINKIINIQPDSEMIEDATNIIES